MCGRFKRKSDKQKVATLDSNEVSYNPSLAKKLTGQSTVFREEQHDLAVGERVYLTQSDQGARVRSGDFATVERIGEDNSLSVRFDNGKSVELDSERARHIDYGYAVGPAHYAGADRVLITGDALQLAQEEKMFAHLSPHTRPGSLYLRQPRTGHGEGGTGGGDRSVDGWHCIDQCERPIPSVPAVDSEELGIGL